jgi:peptidoglycan hydrolase-like protein with peptidoglycan-binding domain
MPPTLSLGSTGDDVRRLQRGLARRAWIPSLSGPVDGVFGPQLDAGVRAFQQTEGLVADGVAGPATWSHLPPYLEASPTVSAGAAGPVVAWLQQVLGGSAIAPDWTPYTGAVDGRFGALTDASLRSLQAAKGVTVDGVAADQTWFAWLTPGTAQHVTLEMACGLVDRLG